MGLPARLIGLPYHCLPADFSHLPHVWMTIVAKFSSTRNCIHNIWQRYTTLLAGRGSGQIYDFSTTECFARHCPRPSWPLYIILPALVLSTSVHCKVSRDMNFKDGHSACRKPSSGSFLMYQCQPSQPWFVLQNLLDVSWVLRGGIESVEAKAGSDERHGDDRQLEHRDSMPQRWSMRERGTVVSDLPSGAGCVCIVSTVN